MSQPQLSILIPSIPSRFDRALRLYKSILDLVGDKNIEVLMLTDNKKRSIGMKREALKNASTGKYFMFTDDDDSLLAIDEVYQATIQDVDVITFQQRCRNKDGSHFMATFGLGYPIEHNTKPDGNYVDIRRPPWHCCPWHEKFKGFAYPDINYAEDWGWLKQVLPLAKTSIHIDQVVSTYDHDPAITEASTESNSHWMNPEDRAALMEREAPVRRCIVNLVTSNPRYEAGQFRLTSSLFKHVSSDYAVLHLYESESSVGAPFHTDNPYAFKIYAIQRVREMGYNQVLWLDASAVAIKHPAPVFDWLTEHGIFLETAGHWAGSWANDACLAHFKITREAAMKMPMFAAGYCGFDFRNPISREFFAEWREAMLCGAFRGSWADHRHDMTCGSIIANKHGLVPRYSPGGQFFAYVGPGYQAPLETACFHLIGL